MLFDLCLVGFYLCGGLVLFGGGALLGVLGLVLGSFFFCVFLFMGNKVFFGMIVLVVYLGGMLLLFTYVACMLGMFKDGGLVGVFFYVLFGFFLSVFEVDGWVVDCWGVNGLISLLFSDFLMFVLFGGVILVLVLVLVLFFSLSGGLVWFG
uniref:NADH dehydrogenase subunit 6 n=1 Tax=Halocynthia spinosa TaxID=569430 RepID=S0DGU8_HALSF|nr:NADH dehydrogenase subunit 6 [Halocynthia spinosa]CCO25773.1 NADH dehydrogenase subunit 6 [Halocynthia spinosa]